MTKNPTVKGRYRGPDEELELPGDFEYVNGVKKGANPDNLPVNTLPADAYTTAGIAFICPGGCGQHGFVTQRNNPEYDYGKGASWNFNGPREAPTLDPSILAPKDKRMCGWHGYLVAGVWKPTDDSSCPGPKVGT